MHLPSLNALKAFEAAGHNLSFRRAADDLGVTPGAISRQIKVRVSLTAPSHALFAHTHPERVTYRPPINAYLMSRYSLNPCLEPSRPKPDSFMPPKGTFSELMPASFTPIMP